MPTCANCPADALYTYRVSATYKLHYCQYHLPKFLANQKTTGQLTLDVEQPVEVVVPKSRKRTPSVQSETISEEPEVITDATDS